jgi:hypothetical protein
MAIEHAITFVLVSHAHCHRSLSKSRSGIGHVLQRSLKGGEPIYSFRSWDEHLHSPTFIQFQPQFAVLPISMRKTTMRFSIVVPWKALCTSSRVHPASRSLFLVGAVGDDLQVCAPGSMLQRRRSFSTSAKAVNLLIAIVSYGSIRWNAAIFIPRFRNSHQATGLKTRKFPAPSCHEPLPL